MRIDKKELCIATLCVTAVLNIPSVGFCQSAVGDTTRARIDSLRVPPDSMGTEMVLGVIEIKGRVEKPSVIIMPKRIEPEMGEVELKRSFEKEVMEGIGEIPTLEKEMDKVERVKSIKKTVERKRN